MRAEPVHLTIMFFAVLAPFVAFGYFFSRHRTPWTVAIRPLIIAVLFCTVFGVVTHHVESNRPEKVRTLPENKYNYGRP